MHKSKATLCCSSFDPLMYQRARWGPRSIYLGPCSASKGCSPEFCCSLKTHSFMRGWEGALRRYLEPSRSLGRGGREDKSATRQTWGADTTAPTSWEKRETGEKEGRNQMELALAGGVGVHLSQQGHLREGCGYQTPAARGWGDSL